jgi:hypothetical protein
LCGCYLTLILYRLSLTATSIVDVILIRSRQYDLSASTIYGGIPDEHQHIIRKELKAVRLDVLSFLPHIVGPDTLLDEDNHAVCYVMAGMTSRSPETMEELGLLWFMLHNNNIHI